MNLRKSLSILITSLAIFLSCLSYSDQVVLKNGDILHGVLKGQTETYLTWESDSFGSFRIPQNQIASINSSDTSPIPITKTKEKWVYSGILGLSGSYLGGNEVRDDLELEVLLTLEQDNLTHNAEINYETLGQENEPTIKDYGLAYGIDWAIDDSWYWGNNIFYGADDKRQIDQSNSLGTSMGYQFWGNDKGSLSSNVGLKWISDKSFYSGTDERLAWAWSSDYQKFLFSGTSLSYSHQLNVSTEDTKNTQLSIDVGLSIPVNDKVDTTISLDWSYDNQPEEGVEQIDRKVNFGINYKW